MNAAGLVRVRLGPKITLVIYDSQRVIGTQQMNDVTDHAASRGGRASDELEYRLRQTQLTTEFGCFAFKTHDVDVLLQEACRVSALGLNRQMAKVLEFLPIERQFLVRAGVGWKPGVVGHARIGVDIDSPAGFAFKTEEPVTSNHLSTEGRFRTPALLIDHGVERAINVIIRAAASCYGVLEVDSHNRGKPFSEADTDFLQGFANLLGVAIERQNAEVKLREALDDQVILTREISHRVKNSLSMVSGMLAMQRRLSDDADVQRALSDAEARVQAIAQVHDRLWRKDEVLNVNAGEFLSDLCLALGGGSPSHTLKCTTDEITLPTDRAIALGVLANELVTNAFKYAYPQGSGQIDLSLAAIGDLLRFEVADGGAGLPHGRDPRQQQSLGMRIIDNISRQLGGEPQWRDNAPGVRFVLEFPTATHAA